MANLKPKHREIGSHTILLNKEQVALNKKVAKLEKHIEVAAKRSPYKWSALILRSGKTGKLYGYPSWGRSINLDDLNETVDLHHAIGGIEVYTVTRPGYQGWAVHHQYATRSCAPDTPVTILYPFEKGWAMWGDYPMLDEALSAEVAPIVKYLTDEVHRMVEEEELRLANEAK
jgi:hypothetical protein